LNKKRNPEGNPYLPMGFIDAQTQTNGGPSTYTQYGILLV
jgi:hypothetical protein